MDIGLDAKGFGVVHGAFAFLCLDSGFGLAGLWGSRVEPLFGKVGCMMSELWRFGHHIGPG